MRIVKETFTLLQPKFFILSTEDEVSEECGQLQRKYPEIFTCSFTNQFHLILDLIKMKHELKENMSVRGLLEHIIKNYSYMEADISEVYTVFLLFFTLPVTVASLERSFSKLKLIKNCMRSTISQEQLCDLSVLSIEYNIASTLDIKEFINQFANAKVEKEQYKNVIYNTYIYFQCKIPVMSFVIIFSVLINH